ncbi:glycosyltransferase family 4 protein [Candidatus Woesearchaeota archaeon]|nr:glycosyltransferase family 4 protein [Candidatus Woesearchaeota archaeon]
MKIVYVLENYLPHIGGVEVLFKHICEGLAKKGHDITIITHRIPGTREKETINGIKVIRVNVPSIASRYFFTFACLPKLMKHAKKADLIHTTTYNGGPPTSFISWLMKKPSVITIHEVIGKDWSRLLEMTRLEGRLHQFLEWLVVSLNYTRYVCVSNSTRNNFLTATGSNDNRGKKYKSSCVIYNGVDYDFWDAGKYSRKKSEEIRNNLDLNDDFVYLFYGRPGPSKGFEHLVSAVKEISKKIPKSRMLAILSKDKAYENRYKRILQRVKDEKIAEHVKIIDPVDRKELPNFIMAADCVVVPSLTEGFGFTVAESCAMGKRIVASNTTSIPEVISGEYNLVEPGNPSDIAKGVINIFNEKFTRTKLKRFEWKKCIDSYEKLYKGILR